MYKRRIHALDDPKQIRTLISDYPWALLAARGEGGVIASHLPCLLDPAADGIGLEDLVLLTHVAKGDPIVDCLAAGEEVLLVFQGPHGYVSPSWYGEGPHVGTWNFTAVHVYGVPELLEGDEGFRVLDLTQERFESLVDNPVSLDQIPDYAQKIAKATTPFRLRATRIEAKAKLSADKPREVRERVVAALETPGPYSNPLLAADMRRAQGKDR
ncbi:MAG: FMN-binding negative transcriptional regulator [Actinomycetota bacterium]|nr:FMN-binding negative transcriptional regulator [Actinomycetota bacterium]